MPEGPLHDTSRYQIGDELGRGGMGRVLEARDLWLGRPVAIKILAPDLGEDPLLVVRLEREARALARLSHPAIATIYSLERTRRGDRLLILERVEGETLARRLRRGPLPVLEALHVAREIAEGLEAAHECGVIHRDLKPSNVMITPHGHVKILDFGLAKIVPVAAKESEVEDRSTSLEVTRRDQAVGTPGYASPEQALGLPADRQADVFAFGCVLFECLAGVRAFPGGAVAGFGATAQGGPPWSALPADVPDAVRELIEQCVARDLQERLPGMREVRHAIGRALGREATPSQLSAARTGARHNLHEPLTSFVGREREVASLREAVAAHRLVTLTGAGGAGKTRLALRVARELRGANPDGVWLADLAPVTEPDRVPHVLSSALALRERADAPVREALLEYLRDKTALVVLDNCEHLRSASASLAADLLGACPGLRVLATSREALRVPGERIVSIPALETRARQGGPIHEPSEAARLFLERAQAVRPDLEGTPRNLEVVEEICRGLEGLPLAVELAAARARVLTLHEIRAKLGDQLRLLAGGTMSGAERHRTLTATIGWSYDLLTPEEQRFVRSLAVFAGGWTFEAARDVCDEEGSGQDEFAILDLLSRMVDKSLATAETGTGDRFRFRWLESVRQYALERLRASGEEAAGRDRHLAYFHALASRAAPELTGPEQGDWLRRLESDHENLLTALGWCRAARGGGKRALEMAAHLWRFWFGHGHFRLARGLLASILADPDAGPSPARGEALLGAGAFAFHQNDFEAGGVSYGEALEVFRALGDERGVGAALGGLGNLDMGRGDLDAARARYEESLLRCRRADYLRGIGLMQSNLGRLEELRGDLSAALPLLESGIEIMRRVGDVGSLALRLSSLAELKIRLGDEERARGLLLECLGLIGDLGESHTAAYALERSAVLLARGGTAREAVRLCGAADAVRRRIASPPSPVERKDIESFFVGLQKEVGGTAFGEAWSEGRSMHYRRAVEEAIAGLKRPAATRSE